MIPKLSKISERYLDELERAWADLEQSVERGVEADRSKRYYEIVRGKIERRIARLEQSHKKWMRIVEERKKGK